MMPKALSDAFAFQGKACAALGSPFMGQLCTLLSHRDWPDTPLRQRYFTWEGDIGPSAQSLPLRLAGGLHALVINGDPLAQTYPPHQLDDDTLWAAVQDALVREDSFLDDWSNSPPQTNEVRRAAVLIAVGQVLADRYSLPMRLSELGASGGLNLMWDRFSANLGGVHFGPKDASMTLAPKWDGAAPPAATPVVIARRGVDLNPLNPQDPTDQLRLRAYLWPDQPDRMTSTVAAIDAFDAHVDQADAIDWLAGQLDHRTNQTHLIYHTIAWQYFPDDVQARGATLIAQAGAKATADTPLAWFGMEPDGATPGAAMTLRLWPGDITVDLGRVDFHGRWVQWKGMT
jgi:hypothetical protein